ncbi:Universal stress protein A-like protein [Raphanus sativus]|uniref:Universal stress protein A-like protein n=1 Tax=Raphanus sativus TaxID=3726 RepID=A0A9W3CZB3_RAPSA|nr:universal stress protein A-like protein [Raphanus sativus]KAJ4867196.1 Universal stress protein A-like protein [Raphanus sativus]
MEREPTRVMVAVNESTIKGKPHPSISSKRAFEWTLEKMVRSNTSDFKILLLHVHVVDEDGFDEVDSIYASPDDFRDMRESNKSKGLHLLEFFVTKCHEIGVSCEHGSRKVIQRTLYAKKLAGSDQIFLFWEAVV